ncbi:hypothetical protein [Microlunatus speluncae]|uniref:hypothetical protein n=1 Tax=Microlunatus speluncae TaxID=2594267 RepID=UPI001266599B|nr:hypothetical protein [Microlunatus speluncae]
MTDANQAADRLQAGAMITRAVAGTDLRPFRRAVLAGAMAQILIFVAFGLLYAYAWNSVTAMIVFAVGVGMTILLFRWVTARRTVILVGLGRLDRFSQWLMLIGGAALVAAASLLSPPLTLQLTGIGPPGLLVGLAGVVLTAPRLVFGLRLGSGQP